MSSPTSVSKPASFARTILRWAAAPGRAWSRIWFQNSPTVPLELCRILVGALLLFQYALVTPYLFEFWGDEGWMTRQILGRYLIDFWAIQPPFAQSVFFYFNAPWQWI